MADLLIDTDVFIDHIRGARKLHLDPGRAAYSVITRAELFAGISKTSKECVRSWRP